MMMMLLLLLFLVLLHLLKWLLRLSSTFPFVLVHFVQSTYSVQRDNESNHSVVWTFLDSLSLSPFLLNRFICLFISVYFTFIFLFFSFITFFPYIFDSIEFSIHFILSLSIGNVSLLFYFIHILYRLLAASATALTVTVHFSCFRCRFQNVRTNTWDCVRCAWNLRSFFCSLSSHIPVLWDEK